MVKFILSFIDYNYIVEFAHKIIIYFLGYINCTTNFMFE